MAATTQPAVMLTGDTLRGDIANALQILSCAFGKDDEDLSAVAARLRSALAKLDGEVPPAATKRILRLAPVRHGEVAADLTDSGGDELQLNYWGGNVRACVFIPRRELPRMAAFARGEEV